MPETCLTDGDLEKLLDDLEDYTLNVHNYQSLQNTLESVDRLTAPVAEKLISLCIRDMTEDLKFATHAVNITATILKKYRNGQCTTLPNLVPSALAVINVLKRCATVDTVETLKTLCFDTLLYHPDETLISLCIHHSNEIFELIQLYGNQAIPADISVEPINLMLKLLTILPSDNKLVFVKDGINVWFLAFLKLIPMVATAINTVQNVLEVLELLTEQLVKFDYMDNGGWLKILENIYMPERYPSLLIGLLEGGSTHWHRLWIIFIKLLKSRITKSSDTSQSPINALLPCVEKAFKMQSPDRCKAFQCWTVLVDNFLRETNEALLNKRLKLLMIPLTSNNAKSEETALAKFETWWNLIIRFQTRMDKFSEMVIIPFLTYCFGKPASKTSDFVPGKISPKTKVQCVQAFINIVGHAKCEGCVAVPKLNVKILNKTLLVSHWKGWIHSLSNAIRICIEQHGEFSDKQIQCVWLSFIMTIAELPENSTRSDLFNEIFIILEGLTQGCDDRSLYVVVNVLGPALFDDEGQVQALLKSTDEKNSLFIKIVALLNKLPLERLQDRKTAVKNMKILTDWGVDDAKTTAAELECLLKSLPPNGVLLWTALAETFVSRIYTNCPRLLAKMFLWPFNYMNSFVTNEESTKAWLDLYNTLYRHLPMGPINKDIVNALFAHSDNELSHLFVLGATIAVLEKKLQLDEDADLDQDVLLILHLTGKMSDEQLKSMLPSLAGVLVQILNGLNRNTNIMIAERIIVIINNILRVFNTLFQQQDCDENGLIQSIENIFNALKSTFRIELYSELKVNLLDQLVKCAPNIKPDKSLHSHIFAIYKKSLNEIVEDSNANQIQNQKTDPVKFTTPKAKVAKKSSKEARIINTVVENGEEFAVIKPNYKFNPRKLTDNQKEKLQRKREDIPALYQDLSQSQDEFKLTTWKMDSQDTSTTTSSKSTNIESTSNDDMAAILKNSEFLPKIIENIVIKPASDLRLEMGEENSRDSNEKSENNNKQNVQKNVKVVKSPRNALKDRIFRNKRNLMENFQKSDSNVNLSSTENKTPLIQKIKAASNITKSAPPQINPERPSRVKRKPKKFDEVQFISLSKKLLSLNPEIDEEMTENQNEMTEKFSNGDQTCIGNEDKVMNVDNPEFEDFASTITTINSDSTDALEQHEKDNLVGKITMSRDDSVSVDNLTSKKTGGIKAQKDDKRNAFIDSKNTVLSTPMVTNHPNEIQQMANHDINKIQHECKMKEKVEEAICSNDLKIDSFTPKLNIIKVRKRSVDTDNKEKNTPKIKKGDFNVTGHSNSDQTSSTVLTRENLCHDNSEINLASKSSDKTQKIEDTICISDTSTNTSDCDEVITKWQPKRHKKSRIEGQLAIDMVERHVKVQSGRRSTVKELENSNSNKKRLDCATKSERKAATEAKNKIKDKRKGKSISITDTPNTEDTSVSQDVIESSQDSDGPTISVKASKPIANKEVVVVLKPLDLTAEAETQNLKVVNIDSINMGDNSDIELPCNKTDVINLTEEMDTQPIDNAVIDLCVDEDPITIFEEVTNDPPGTENIAEVDTQPVDPDMFLETDVNGDKTSDTDQPIIGLKESDRITDDKVEVIIIVENNENVSETETAEDITETLSESVLVNAEKEDLSSSCNNERRKKDFIDDTLQISPIKSMSPIRDQKSPSPETSSDYDLIKFTSPVQSNGEPFETCESPEIFTEDKVSPDRRDQSPPRAEVCVKNTSPSSSLSLKKKRPQMRPGGRAAQMLGMCVSDRQTIVPAEKSKDDEEVKKSPSLNSSARRNLRALYSSASNEKLDDTDESGVFLKFKRTLPSTDSSPAGPILKRKLIAITDETTASPASKRKRVSFHDPPVSTTICVKKYIEPMGVRSPQNSAHKQLERQTRAQTAVKSPKRLDSVFKLDSVLTKAVESFSEANETPNMTEDTENVSSLDETPVVEVVKTSDLNDTDPICPELVDCEDRIEHIAAELSSPAMKALLVKNFEGKVETIGDLAKMTELEVNRLCIKAPKVQVAKKVLNDYLSKVKLANEEITPTVEAALSETTTLETKASVEVQTDSAAVQSIEMQTEVVAVASACLQTDSVQTSHTSVQTEESGSKSTAEVLKDCVERPDFVETLLEAMDEPLKQRLAERLPFDVMLKTFMEKLSKSDGSHASIIPDVIECCSTALKKIFDKPA